MLDLRYVVLKKGSIARSLRMLEMDLIYDVFKKGSISKLSGIFLDALKQVF